jgi:hypothetical protein
MTGTDRAEAVDTPDTTLAAITRLQKMKKREICFSGLEPRDYIRQRRGKKIKLTVFMLGRERARLRRCSSLASRTLSASTSGSKNCAEVAVAGRKDVDGSGRRLVAL